jgi:hypothetical protein
MNYPPSTLLLLLVLATIATVAPAFTLSHQRGVTTLPHRRSFLVKAAAEEENNTNNNNNNIAKEEDEEPTLITSTEATAEESVIEEDPALTALKQEIADLESAVKAKTRQVSVAQEQAERYTQSGYARRVAEVENMRRLRKVGLHLLSRDLYRIYIPCGNDPRICRTKLTQSYLYVVHGK